MNSKYAFFKVFKSFLIVLLVFAVTVVQFPEVFSATDNEDNYVNELLDALEITMPQDKILSRSDAAAFAARLFKLTPVYGEENPFDDVMNDDENKPYIIALYNKGIISGNDGLFMPDQRITYNEFYKIIVSLMGYGGLADAKGGYPVQYAAMAKRLDLTSNTAASGDDELSVTDAARIAYNTLHARIYDISTLSGDFVEYKEGETVLKSYYGIDYIEGVVTGNSVTSLSSPEKNIGRIFIDSLMYKTDGSFDDLLGYRVKAYIDEEYVVYMSPYYTNKTSTYVGDDATVAKSKTQIKVITDEKEKNYKLDEFAVVFYNGVYKGNISTSKVTTADLCIENASYVLLDNDNDNVYEYIFVRKYTYFIAETFDKSTMKLIDKLSGASIYIIEEDSLKFPDGTKTEFSKIKYNDVIAMCIPENFVKDNSRTEPLSLLLVDDTVYGIADGKTADKIIISGEKYEVNTEYTSVDELYEKAGTFFLDVNRRIIGISVDNKLQNGTEYAYIAAIGEREGLSSARCKLLLQSGELTVMKIDENVTVKKGEKQLYKGVDAVLANKNSVIDSVVKVKISGKNEIKMITLAEPVTYGYAGKTDDEFNVISGRTFISRSNILDDLYKVNPSLIVFAVPEDINDDSAYSVRSKLPSKEKKTIDVYSIDKSYGINVALTKIREAGGSEIKEDTEMFVVREIINVVDAEENEILTGAIGYIGGTEKEIVFSSSGIKSKTSDPADGKYNRQHSIYASELECGDVIHYVEDESGKVDTFRVLCDVSEGGEWAYSYSSENDDGIIWGLAYPFSAKALIYCYGEIADKTNNILTIQFPNAGVRKNLFFGNLKRIYLVDTTEKKIELIDRTDDAILAGEKVFVDFSWGKERNVVIYK